METDLGFSIPQFLRKDAMVPPTTPRTPLPWRAINRNDLTPDDPPDHYWEIEAGRGYHSDESDDVTGFGLSGWIWPQDAQYIAHACNCFPELLQSLEQFMAWLDEGLLVRDISKDAAPDWAPKTMQFVVQLHKAKGALAKAKGES